MAMAATGSEQKIPLLVVADERGEADKEPVATVKRRQKPGRKLNGVIKGDTRSMYISPGESMHTFSQSSDVYLSVGTVLVTTLRHKITCIR